MHAHAAPRPGGIPPRLAHVLRRRWDAYEREAQRLERDGPTEPFVHDFRVAARRLMTLLRLLERLGADHGARGLRRRVRRCFRRLARLRDVHVEQALAVDRARQHPILLRYARHLGREEARLRRARRGIPEPHALREQQRRCTALLRHGERSDEATTGTVLLQRELRRELRSQAETVALRNAAARAGDPENLHQLRVSLKKFRYLLEAARWLDGGGPTAPLVRARRWQARLGHLQDLRVLRDNAGVYGAALADPAWAAAQAALEAELAAKTRSYLRVRSRLTELVTPYLDLAGEGPTA